MLQAPKKTMAPSHDSKPAASPPIIVAPTRTVAKRNLNASLSRSPRSSSRPRRQETEDSVKAGRVWAREVDDSWWPCILTLDGGGIRGYSSLLILKELMHQVCLWEQKLEDELPTQGSGKPRGRPESRDGWIDDTLPGADEESPTHDSPQQQESTDASTTRRIFVENDLLPCHYFDFMYGTSTGGLIATMLGRLRMTIDECLELYRKVGNDLFGRRKSSIPFFTKYHHQPLEKAVQDIVSNRCHDHRECDGTDCLHPWPSEVSIDIANIFDVDQPRLCQSCCLTATHDESISEAYLLRTYSHHYSDSTPNWITRYNEGADPLKIWQVTRATSAAPFYFQMLEAEVNGELMAFKDGGIRENNPSGAALSEFHSLYHGKAATPAILLSVGTGRPDTKQDGFASAWPGPFGGLRIVRQFMEKVAVLQNALIRYTEGERQHNQMREVAQGEHTWYKRLNVNDGLQNMPLDEWVKGEWNGKPNVAGGASLTRMEGATARYLKRQFDPIIDSYAPPSVLISQAAEKLVRQRRARELDGGARWETFIGKNLHHKNTALDARPD